MNSNQVDTLVTLANYFRGAMMDEIKLPEHAASMPQLVKVDGFKMLKVSEKADHYREVVDEIEKSLEAYALQLNALMPTSIDTQKKIEFKENKTTAKPKKEDEAVVDAETNLKSNAQPTVNDLLEKKESDKSQPIYGSLLAIPDERFKAEDKQSIMDAWNAAKGVEAKAKVYNKVRNMLNNYDIPVALLRSDIAKFIAKQKGEHKNDNFAQFEKELKEAGIQFDTTTDLSKIRSGEELTTGKIKWADKEGNFKIELLTDGKTEDDVDPQNFVKLWAMQLRTIGEERQALDILTKFYSDTEKGTIWSAEKARWFLNNLFRVNKFKELTYVIENMLIAKHLEGDYKKAIPFAKSFLINYTKTVKEVEKEGKKVKVEEFWPAHKVENFINRAVKGLRMAKLLKHDERTAKKVEKVTFEVNYQFGKDKKIFGKITGLTANVNMSAYETLDEFKKACTMVAMNQARFKNPDVKEEDVTINFTEDKTNASQEGGKKDTFQAPSAKDKMAVQTKPTAANTAKKKESGNKTVKIVKNPPSKDVKKGQTGKSTQNQNKALKTAKKGQSEQSTKSNVKEKKMPPAKPNSKPQYSALIELDPKSKTYSCVINGFSEVVKVTGAKTVEEAKVSFVEALRKYNEKVAEENDKARANFKKGKGKMLHMKPDFTKGELTFLLKTKKTGTNG